MDVNQLYQNLSFGQLSNLSISEEGNGLILDSKKPKIILYANEALLRLHTRYMLRESDVLVELVDHITHYHLLKKFAESQWQTSGQDFLYIKDLMREPFDEDVIRILAIYDSYGQQLPLNDDHALNSCFTPQGNVLQITRPVTGVALSILYQARHPRLSVDNPDQEIFLPDVLHAALTAFIAYKTYSDMNTQEATAKAQEHLGIYEAICDEVAANDLVSTSRSTTNNCFQQRGWI